MADRLRTLLTPALLHLIVDMRIPFSMTEPLDFADVGRVCFGGESHDDEADESAWPVLLAMGEIGLDNMPDMLTFLPPTSDSDFPRQALGLQLLLDQMPRRLCRGIHGRWTNCYFDVISSKLAMALDALPEDVSPYSWSRWKDSATLDYWVLVRTWFVAPFVHVGEVAMQKRAAEFTETTRRQVEAATGTTDPYRESREAIGSDIYGFARVVVAGPPQENASIQAYTYWMCMLMDIHKPIVDKFGRYPYRNAMFGIQNTAEEDEWCKEMHNFGCPTKAVSDRLKDDIQAGIWTPLAPTRDS